MATFLQDVRHGFRMLVTSPGFSVIAIITLALGVGANSAFFTLTCAVILKTLPVPNPASSMTLWGMVAVLCLVSAAASCISARRATPVDPMDTPRCE